jgi:serine/threonine-protein kinase
VSARIVSGRYALRDRLGAGGVGEVWSATDRTTGGEVAIKLLRELHVDNPEVRERFLREGRLLARIDSPHVCRVLGSGADEDGTPYLVVERIAGTPLDVVLRGGKKLPFPVAARVVGEILAGLAAVHRAQVVHRDLKPSNTLVLDGAGAVKLIDFGIGKVLAPGEPVFTATQTTLGSPIYMAPEQINGSRQVDARCDLYAVGTIAFRVLSGDLPFAAENPTRMLIMKQNYPAASLRERTGTPWPEPIEAFLREMLAQRPEARPPGADHALAAWRGACAAAVGALPDRSAAATAPLPPADDGVDDAETPVLPRRR